ncbi:hypothetical protein [Streptomyces gobiensis]|nr:hypothetical protein [Streptomyces gobiensis]UGY94873.1 hypothetical protein test1122_26130 [Streptomyces gobiensis]
MVTPLGVRGLDPPELRRTVSVAYQEGESASASATLRAPLRGGFGSC